MSRCYAQIGQKKLPDCGSITTKAWRIKSFGEVAGMRFEDVFGMSKGVSNAA
jgi:hypothetical protein